VAPRHPLVYIMSDSIGGTAEMVVRAAASQYEQGLLEIQRFTHVDTTDKAMRVIEQACGSGAIVVFTLVLPEMREFAKKVAGQMGVTCVDIMGPMMDALGQATASKPRLEPGLVRRLDDEYYRRIEAIEFTVTNDDGKNPGSLSKADVVMLGVSRTSKTPVSLYLAQERCLKVANTPLVPEIEPPEELFFVNPGKIIGLTISPLLLSKIRQERARNLGLPPGSSYCDIDRIRAELSYAERLYRRLSCAVLDVSNKAVEETASMAIDIVNRSQGERV
jgi:regulator of PEP synthase PpsR (kinase-PPPase family)